MQSSLVGKLLIAMPNIHSSGFRRTVILLCAHDEEHAMGLVLNRRLSDLDLSELFEHMGVEGDDDMPDLPILSGGPVGQERGFVLHSDDYDCESATLPVIDGVCLTANRDILHAVATGDAPEHAVLALGYAGWGAGQLEQELANNVWLVGTSSSNMVFDRSFDTKWSRALHALGVSPERLCAGGNA